MRLPLPLCSSQFFIFATSRELVSALGDSVETEELQDILRHSDVGLPPVTSVVVLSTMLGLGKGLVWSILKRPGLHYRTFEIKKGRGSREISSPRVALKIIQKWLSLQISRKYEPPAHVFGFVQGRSHIQAASRHVGAKWIYSVDVRNFFGTTPKQTVNTSLIRLGFSSQSANLVSKLCCLNEYLPQGSPSSPVLSNIAFEPLDIELARLANTHKITLSRYADDIVFSGSEEFPHGIEREVQALFDRSPWKLAANKIEFSALPNRLKVHGLLVHGRGVRLTKGYRNKIRAFKHLYHNGTVKAEDMERIKGHLLYAHYIESLGIA